VPSIVNEISNIQQQKKGQEVWFQLLFSHYNNEFQKTHIREISIRKLTSNTHRCTLNRLSKQNNGVLSYTFTWRTDFTWLMIPSTLQSRTVGIQEVIGNRISTSSRLPERQQFLSEHVLAAKITSRINFLIFDSRKRQTCRTQGFWASVEHIHTV
jgi:hypothetical protein